MDVFFALSGFLITSLLCEEFIQHGRIGLPHFYMRRVLRLYPALLLMVFAVSWLTPAKLYVLSSLTYTTNWVIALGIRPLNLELGHTWSLAVEEQYYLLWPPLLILLLRFMPPRKAVWFPFVLGLISAALRAGMVFNGAEFWRLNAGFDTHSDGLLLGSTLGILSAYGLIPASRALERCIKWGTMVSGGGLLIACVFFPHLQDFFCTAGFFLVALFTLAVIYLTILQPVGIMVRILESSVLVWLGAVSYGLYLWQVPVVVFLNLEMLGWPAFASDTIQVALIMFVTFISYRYVERPILRLKKRFSPAPNGG